MTAGGPTNAPDRGGGRSLVLGIDASRAFCARQTGTERYATEVIRHLVALTSHRVRLYLREHPVETPPPRADQRYLPGRRAWTHTRLFGEMWRHSPDVLFVPAHVLPVVLPCPSVVTVHDLGYLVFPDAHPRRQRIYLDWTTRHHVRHATRIVADSAATADDLVTRYRADPARLSVIHLGVDDGIRRAPPASVDALRARLGLATERPYLLHVGTLQPRKNLARLLQAFQRVAAARADLDLVVAGSAGWGDEDLPGVAEGLGLARRVHFSGYVPRSDLPALYSGAVALVHPSLYEGFGLTLLEAMACGTPVLASGTSSLPEVVGDAGLLFDPLDVGGMAAAIARVVGDADLRARLGDLGRQRACAFTWERCAAATLRVLEEAAARPT